LNPIIVERIGSKFYFKDLFKGTRDGFTNDKFHNKCDNQGPLLVLAKTCNDILIGGLSTVSWQNSGNYVVDPKCVVFSLTRKKVYQRINDKNNLFFSSSFGPLIGCNGFRIDGSRI
jgi:hypothetical protein